MRKFTNRERKGKTLAECIAKEISGETFPEVLQTRGSGDYLTYHFEGGVVAKIHFLPGFDVVSHAEVRFYAGPDDSEKTSEVWEAERLLELKEKYGWDLPRIQSPFEVTGEIVIFWSNVERNGYVEVDPDYSQSWDYIAADTVSYRPYVEGDLERAQKLARQKLDEFLEEE